MKKEAAKIYAVQNIQKNNDGGDQSLYSFMY